MAVVKQFYQYQQAIKILEIIHFGKLTENLRPEMFIDADST